MHTQAAKPLDRGRETEIKLPIQDMGKLLTRLETLGAKPQGRVFERNTLYDTPSARFRRARCLLRVRQEWPAPARDFAAGRRRTVITWKAPLVGAKVSSYKEKLEQETVMPRPCDWSKVLERLGLRRTFQYEKYRTPFCWAGLHLDLDETPIGVFLEIEGLPKAIDRAASRLGFSVRDYGRQTYWDLYAAHCKRLGQKPRNMIFRHQNSVKSSVFA